MKKLENIDEFIAKSQYSILVKQFGLSYVLDKWKTACENMPYRKKYLVYEYLNDLCTRDVLDEIFTHCAVSDEHQKILADCDELFRKKTVIVKEGAVHEVLFYYRLYSPYFPRSCSIFSFFDYFDG